MFEAELRITVTGETHDEVKDQALSIIKNGCILNVDHCEVEVHISQDEEYVDSDSFTIENGFPQY